MEDNFRSQWPYRMSSKVDKDGNVTETTYTWYHKESVEDYYVKLYVENLEYLLKMPTSCHDLLIYLLKEATYNGKGGGQVLLPSGKKKEISEKLGHERVSSLDNDLSRLVKGKILLKEGTGLYTLNPFLFGKGKWTDVIEERKRFDPVYEEINGKRYTDYVKPRKGGNNNDE